MLGVRTGHWGHTRPTIVLVLIQMVPIPLGLGPETIVFTGEETAGRSLMVTMAAASFVLGRAITAEGRALRSLRLMGAMWSSLAPSKPSARGQSHLPLMRERVLVTKGFDQPCNVEKKPSG